jgi:hypothetical protein
MFFHDTLVLYFLSDTILDVKISFFASFAPFSVPESSRWRDEKSCRFRQNCFLSREFRISRISHFAKFREKMRTMKFLEDMLDPISLTFTFSTKPLFIEYFGNHYR